MGCGASLCTAQQQEEIFTIAAKEMLTQCLADLVPSPQKLDEMHIPLPPEVEKVRKLAANLREVAGLAKGKMAESAKGGLGAGAAAQRASGSGGLFAGLGDAPKAILQGSAHLLDKAAEAVGGGFGMAAEKAFLLAADDLDQKVVSLQDALSYAARGWIFNKQDDVKKVFGGIIQEAKIQNVIGLVRGAKPQGPAQYKACASDAISSYFIKTQSGKLVESLLPIALDVVAKNKAKEDWDSLMWKYDQANKKLAEYESSKSMVQEPINLDINKYIVEKTIPQFGELMGKEEAKRRENPTTATSASSTFRLCFSADLGGYMSLSKNLPLECYKNK